MSKLDELRQAYEEADAEAINLSGEYQRRLDEEVTGPWQRLKDEYTDRIREANDRAREAQQAYCDAEAANALLDHPNPEGALSSHSGPGGDRLREAYRALTE